MTRAGYAIEYDYYPPTQLDATLQVKALPGSVLRGADQRDDRATRRRRGRVWSRGSTRAWLRSDRPPIVPWSRDVVHRRSRRRPRDARRRRALSALHLALRIPPDRSPGQRAPASGYRSRPNLASTATPTDTGAEHRLAAEDEAMELAGATSVRPEAAAPLLDAAGSSPLAHAMRISEVVKRQGVALADLFAATGVGTGLVAGGRVTTELELKYAGYFERERSQAEKIRRMGEFLLDDGLPTLECARCLQKPARSLRAFGRGRSRRRLASRGQPE